jgi:hypothetical protein
MRERRVTPVIERLWTSISPAFSMRSRRPSHATRMRWQSRDWEDGEADDEIL